MKRCISLLICALITLNSMAYSIKYTVIYNGLEQTEDVKQSVEYNMICSIVDPAWRILVSKDSAPFDSLLLKMILEDADPGDDDPINVLLGYITENMRVLFYYSAENKTYGGLNIEMPEAFLLDVAKKYDLPSELAGAEFARDARWSAFVKENEATVMEKLLDVVSYMDINESLKIIYDKPVVRKITSVAEFSKMLYGCDDIDSAEENNNTLNKSLSWRNNSAGKYLVTLSYSFSANVESQNTSYWDAVANTLGSLDIGENNRIMISRKIEDGRYPILLSVGFHSSRDYLDKWCFRLISILYNKFNTFVITDNLGNESKMPIIYKPFMSYANMTYSNKKKVENILQYIVNVGHPDVAEIQTGTSLFNPFGILYANPGMSNYYFDEVLHLDADIRCNVGFLLSESEIEKYSSFKPHFK